MGTTSVPTWHGELTAADGGAKVKSNFTSMAIRSFPLFVEPEPKTIFAVRITLIWVEKTEAIASLPRHTRAWHRLSVLTDSISHRPDSGCTDGISLIRSGSRRIFE